MVKVKVKFIKSKFTATFNTVLLDEMQFSLSVCVSGKPLSSFQKFWKFLESMETVKSIEKHKAPNNSI